MGNQLILASKIPCDRITQKSRPECEGTIADITPVSQQQAGNPVVFTKDPWRADVVIFAKKIIKSITNP